MKKNEINSILTVGGSSKMQFVSRRLKEFIGIEPYIGIQPDEAVVMGASIFGEMKINGNLPNWLKTVKITDICPFSIGTSNDLNGKMSFVIHKGDKYPLSKTIKGFDPVLCQQENFHVDIFEGENEMAQNNQLIGQFKVSNLPHKKEYLFCNITLSIDECGILSVKAELKDKEEKRLSDADLKQTMNNELIHTQKKSSQIKCNNKELKIIEKIRESKYYVEYKVENRSTGELFLAKYFYQNIKDYSYEQRARIREILKYNLQINHPGIVKNIKFLENGFDKEEYTTLLTEFQHLKSLEELNKNELKFTQKLIIAYGIASTMSYLHKNFILHRELSSSNIFIDDNFHPKLDNIGFYDNINSIDKICKIENIPFFFAPEYYESNKYTEKSDVYSYGFILYSLFSKSKIEEEINLKEILNDISQHKKPTIIKEIPECFHQLIEKCFSQDESERPKFDEICQKLEKNTEFNTEDIDYDEYKRYINIINSIKYNQSLNKPKSKNAAHSNKKRNQKSKSKQAKRSSKSNDDDNNNDDDIPHKK